MKAIILDGSKTTDNTLQLIKEITEKKLKSSGWDVSALILRDIEIAPCLGCFGCWVKTPGKCIINDAEIEITKNAFQSDLLVFLTPITFGGYSSEIKKVLDRWISIVLPFFEKYNGEVHHIPRYFKHPSLFFIGITGCNDVESEATFKDLSKRISINSRAPAWASEIFVSYEKIDEIDRTIVHQLAIFEKQYKK